MKKKKVLIIDDEEDFGMLMKRFFSQKNYDVYVAYTISDGMKLLNEVLPDIIFLDNNLPDGWFVIVLLVGGFSINIFCMFFLLLKRE